MVSAYQGFVSKFITCYPTILVTVMRRQPISISELHRATDITYSHLQKSIGELSAFRLIRRRRNGRVVNLYMTGAGESLAKNFATVLPKLLDLKEAKAG